MNKQELILNLKSQQEEDYEFAHMEADKLLIEFINDDEITEAFNNLPKGYS